MNTALPGTLASVPATTASPTGLVLAGLPDAAAVPATGCSSERRWASVGGASKGLSLLPEVALHGSGLLFASTSTDDTTGLPPRAAPV